MQSEPLGLLVFLVPIQTQPAQPVKNGIDRGFCITLNVSVVEPQDHRSAVPAGIQQLKINVRALPTCRKPVGDGANRTRNITREYSKLD